jgi:hypothetical protein
MNKQLLTLAICLVSIFSILGVTAGPIVSHDFLLDSKGAGTVAFIGSDTQFTGVSTDLNARNVVQILKGVERTQGAASFAIQARDITGKPMRLSLNLKQVSVIENSAARLNVVLVPSTGSYWKQGSPVRKLVCTSVTYNFDRATNLTNVAGTCNYSPSKGVVIDESFSVTGIPTKNVIK